MTASSLERSVHIALAAAIDVSRFIVTPLMDKEIKSVDIRPELVVGERTFTGVWLLRGSALAQIPDTEVPVEVDRPAPSGILITA